MAHKHNRRRIRPRSRPNNSLNFNSSSTSTLNLGTSSPYLSRPQATHQTPSSLPASLFASSTSMGIRHWQNRYVAWQNRESAQRREEAKLEAEQIQVFGGEPGDDVDLCFKMMEVFEGMEWINT